MNRAKAFYEKTLQTTLQRLESPELEMWMFPAHPGGFGVSGTLIKVEGKDSGTGGTIAYFACEDCAAEAARAAENGGRVHRDKMSIGQYGFVALVVDTEGNMIGLHSMK